MNVDDIKPLILNFFSSLEFETPLIDGPLHYHVKEERSTRFQNQLSGADFYGIYVYSCADLDIMYIGMAFEATIGARAWSHLGSTSWDDPNRQFLDHRWINSPNISEDTKSVITSCDFTISSFPIEPKHFVPLTESYLLVKHLESTGKLPPLNQKLT